MVVRNDVLEEYPELNKVFNKIEGILNDEKMADLNYEVEAKGREAEDVAHEFLVNLGITKNGDNIWNE